MYPKFGALGLLLEYRILEQKTRDAIMVASAYAPYEEGYVLLFPCLASIEQFAEALGRIHRQARSWKVSKDVVANLGIVVL